MIRPISGFVILADDPIKYNADGVIIDTTLGTNYLDYYVVASRVEGIGSGDRVILSDPNAGKRLMIDGVPCRLVHEEFIIAKGE